MRIRKNRLNIDQVPVALDRREEFHTGRLRAEFASEATFGELPERYHAQFREACRDPQTYVLRSSGTPIAWRTFLDGWVVPEGLDNVPRSHREILRRAIVLEETGIDLYAEVG